MAWNSAVITNSGLSALAGVLTSGELSLTAAGLASGTVDEASLMAQTALTAPISDVSALIAASTPIENGLQVKLQIRNTGLLENRIFTQIGLWATCADRQILFAIAQDERGEEVPSSESYPDYMLEFTMVIAVSQTEGITVQINPSAVVTAGTLAEILTDYVKDEDIPKSLPANGGNADTVNKHTVESDVPENAKFTDTTYSEATAGAAGLMSATDKAKLNNIAEGANNYTHPTYTARTGVPTANQTPAFGGSFTVTQPVSDGSGHITGMNGRSVTIPATAASATTPGLVNTGAQTFAGAKTFNAAIYPNGATAYGTPQARKLSSGTAVADATNCPSGAWRGQHS